LVAGFFQIEKTTILYHTFHDFSGSEMGVAVLDVAAIEGKKKVTYSKKADK